MTNFERIKNMDFKEMLDFLEKMCYRIDCDNCSATGYCEKGRIGFKKWLESEVEE